MVAVVAVAMVVVVFLVSCSRQPTGPICTTIDHHHRTHHSPRTATSTRRPYHPHRRRDFQTPRTGRTSSSLRTITWRFACTCTLSKTRRAKKGVCLSTSVIYHVYTSGPASPVLEANTMLPTQPPYKKRGLICVLLLPLCFFFRYFDCENKHRKVFQKDGDVRYAPLSSPLSSPLSCCSNLLLVRGPSRRTRPTATIFSRTLPRAALESDQKLAVFDRFLFRSWALRAGPFLARRWCTWKCSRRSCSCDTKTG